MSWSAKPDVAPACAAGVGFVHPPPYFPNTNHWPPPLTVGTLFEQPAAKLAVGTGVARTMGQVLVAPELLELLLPPELLELVEPPELVVLLLPPELLELVEPPELVVLLPPPELLELVEPPEVVEPLELVEPPELVEPLVLPLVELLLESTPGLVPSEQARPTPAIAVNTIGPITEEMRISTPLGGP
jgi:hypothetical protein